MISRWIEAKRAGREKLGSLAEVLRGISTHEIQIALALDPPVGDEFALRRELRRRELARGGPR